MSCHLIGVHKGANDSVYVGKYRGRKVAISEFREHLSESELAFHPCGSEADSTSGYSRTQATLRIQPPQHCPIRKYQSLRCGSTLSPQRGICIPEDNSQIQCMLVSELCENGDLFDYIVSSSFVCRGLES